MYLEQLLLGGVLGGAVLSLVGVGFTLVIGVGKVANFAHGAFVAVGMYLGYWIGHTLGLNPYVLFVPALLVFTLIGWGIAELFEWRGREGRGAREGRRARRAARRAGAPAAH